jgi:hypothetical protein
VPVRVRVIPPGEFIRNHLRDAGGVDYVQAIHKAYKATLLAAGYKNGSCRETMSKYIWLAKKLGLIIFDHAEAPAYWDAVVDGVRVTRAYRPEGRPRAPSPRHYYRLVDETDPRWVRLEASYRQTIGIEVPPPMPRVPWVPRPVEYPIPPEELAAAPPAPPPPPTKKVRKSKAKKVKKPTPAQTAEQVSEPIEARIQTVLKGLDLLLGQPTTEVSGAIEDEMLDIADSIVTQLEGKRGIVRDRLNGLSALVSRALNDYDLVRTALRSVIRETLPARRAAAQTALESAVRVVREDLTSPEEV